MRWLLLIFVLFVSPLITMSQTGNPSPKSGAEVMRELGNTITVPLLMSLPNARPL
jgi:hypothetical protein